MNNNPLVSIIVPVYNSADYLSDCLESILNQSYQNLEIITVNDGSTDNSLEILQEYAKLENQIKIIDQDNQGLSGARNTGIKKATGDYITFIDSDDYVEPLMIDHMMDAIKDTKSDIACCSFREVFPDGKKVDFNTGHKAKTLTTEEALKAMLKEQGFMVSTTMKLFPTKFFKDIKFPEGMLHEDVGTTYKLIMRAKKIAFIPDADYIYVHHSDSIISGFDNRKFDLIELTDEMCNEIDQKYPELKNTTNERRMRARFSILRQIPSKHPKVRILVNYLKFHKTFITRNPEASRNDKIALRLALISPRLFKLAYKLFK